MSDDARGGGTTPPGPQGSPTGPQQAGGQSGGQSGGPSRTQPDDKASESSGSSGSTTQAQRGPSSATKSTEKDPLRSSRASGIWAAVAFLVVLLTFLSIFVLQNTQAAQVNFLGWTVEAPQAAILLIAVAAGLLVAVMAGTLRILQLRHRVRREQKRGRS